MSDENILSRVPGQYLAAALQTLPKAETAAVDTMEATIDVPGIGAVRVTAKRMKAKRGKVSHYSWTLRRRFRQSAHERQFA